MKILIFFLPKKTFSLNNSLLFFLVYLVSTSVHAGPSLFKLPDNIQIHGFLSQSFSHSSDNNFLGKTDDNISTDFRELGVNGSWRLLPRLQLAAQVVWRDAGETDEDGLRLDYGYANYHLFSSESSLIGVKAGRIPSPFGFYNDTRDVAATRPGIYLPQSIYLDFNRNFALSADGGHLYGEYRTDYGDFFLTAGLVVPRADDPQLTRSISSGLPGKLDGDASWITQGNYEWQGGRVRLAVTRIDLYLNLEPDNIPGNPALPGEFNLDPWVFSAQYNAENWSLTGEYEIRSFSLNGFITPDQDIIGESYYLQGTYNLTSKLQAMLRYDVLYVNRDDKSGRDFARVTGVPAHSQFAKDFAAGLRYEIFPSMLISGEYHNVDGTGTLATIENTNGSKRHWELFTLQFSYSF